MLQRLVDIYDTSLALHVAAIYGFRQCIYDCSIEYHNVVHVKLFCINLYHEMMHAMAQMRNVEG